MEDIVKYVTHNYVTYKITFDDFNVKIINDDNGDRVAGMTYNYVAETLVKHLVKEA